MKYTINVVRISLLLSSILLSSVVVAQTEIKVNSIFLPVGILNVAVEKPITPKFSIQLEVFVSPWESFGGKNLQIYMGTIEGRYYLKEMTRGWYVGVYGSIGAFNLQKWNYFTPQPIFDEEGNTELLPDGSVRKAERYQKGLALIVGISGGYSFKINEYFGLDAFVGIGTTQSLYKGYFNDNNQRYDGAQKWNRSGELIPTRAGLMLTYLLN